MPGSRKNSKRGNTRKCRRLPYVRQSGKGVALLSLPYPERYVRLSSHTAQASQRHSLTGRPASSFLRCLHDTDRVQLNVSVYGGTSRNNLPSSAFPYESCLSGFLVTRHLLEVCSFSRRANSEPVSTPLQHRLRFLQHPLPAAQSVGLATVLPKGSAMGLPCSACLPVWVRFQLYVDGAPSAAGEA
jgi:hypothetical protein